MSQLTDHPLRYALSNELHARPFPVVAAPSHAVYLALKPTQNAAARDRAADRAHLIALLDRFGAQHPQPGATHWFGPIGKHQLKWESHTEFVTYTLFISGLDARPFDPAAFDLFPADWLAEAPGTRVTSALIRVETLVDDDDVIAKSNAWFVPESLALSRVIDGELIIGADFRIDPAGHMRMAIFARPGVSERRIGRVVQRLCEIETYKSMSMLGLARARDMGPEMGQIDAQLSTLLADMCGEMPAPDQTLSQLLAVSAQLENIIARPVSALERPGPMKPSSTSGSRRCARSASKAARPSRSSWPAAMTPRCGRSSPLNAGFRPCPTAPSARAIFCARGWTSNARPRTRNCWPAWTSARKCGRVSGSCRRMPRSWRGTPMPCGSPRAMPKPGPS